MPARVKRKAVYLDRPLTPAEQAAAKESNGVQYQQGARPGPHLEDRKIEDRAHRIHFPKGEGKLCITIEPGYEHLGQIYVNVQFEARPGEHESCQEGQNRFLISGTDWVKALLEQLSEGVDTTWDINFDAKPCPGATRPVAILEAVQHMEGTMVTGSVGPTVTQQTQVKR